VPLPPAVGRAIDRAVGFRIRGPILLNSHSTRMDRHAATRRLRHLAETAGIQLTRAHPHMLHHTFVTTMLDAGVDLRDVQIAARHADPRTTTRYDRARHNLDRHPNYILATYMVSGTFQNLRPRGLGRGGGQCCRERARRGWEAGGVDDVPAAIEAAAAESPGAAGLSYVVGDATRLPSAGLGMFDFFLDIGCVQGLDAGQRLSMGGGVG